MPGFGPDPERMNPGVVYALVAACGLGAVTTQAKFVYADGGNALTLMFWRFVMSVLVIGLLVILQRGSFRLPRETRMSAVLVGIIWSASMICYLMAVESISVSLAVLILYSYPVLVFVASVASGRLALSARTAVAFFTAFTGLALMLLSKDQTPNLPGILFAMLAACGAAYTFLAGGAVANRMNPLVLTFWVNLMGILLIMPLVYGRFSMPSSHFALTMLGGATLCYVIAIVCQFQSLARMPSAKAAFVFNFEPVVSILLALGVLGESLSYLQWTGAGLVILVLLGSDRILRQEGRGPQ